MKNKLHHFRKCNKVSSEEWKPIVIKSGRSFTCPKLIYLQEQQLINSLIIMSKHDRTDMNYLLLRAIIDTENEMSIINNKLAEMDKA